MLNDLRNELKRSGDKRKAEVLRGFFKTGPGQYGEGDIFLGVTVPEQRKIARKYPSLPLKDAVRLLRSPVHEERLTALIILVSKYTKEREPGRRRIFETYIKETAYINNWDLVDLTASRIVGDFLLKKDKKMLYSFARSRALWERRIAIVATYRYIKEGTFTHTLRISEMLLGDKEDLIHKAVGWMLREVGKRSRAALETFLKKHYKMMPRTTLRYAIERFPSGKRRAY